MGLLGSMKNHRLFTVVYWLGKEIKIHWLEAGQRRNREALPTETKTLFFRRLEAVL